MIMSLEQGRLALRLRQMLEYRSLDFLVIGAIVVKGLLQVGCPMKLLTRVKLVDREILLSGQSAGSLKLDHLYALMWKVLLLPCLSMLLPTISNLCMLEKVIEMR